jgi:hypothetical protein
VGDPESPRQKQKKGLLSNRRYSYYTSARSSMPADSFYEIVLFSYQGCHSDRPVLSPGLSKRPTSMRFCSSRIQRAWLVVHTSMSARFLFFQRAWLVVRTTSMHHRPSISTRRDGLCMWELARLVNENLSQNVLDMSARLTLFWPFLQNHTCKRGWFFSTHRHGWNWQNLIKITVIWLN